MTAEPLIKVNVYEGNKWAVYQSQIADQKTEITELEAKLAKATELLRRSYLELTSRNITLPTDILDSGILTKEAQ